MGRPIQIFVESDQRALNDAVAIWRYVPLRTLFFHLNGLVFIPSVANLRAGDPFEGEFYEDIAWFNDAFHKRYGLGCDRICDWIFKNLCSEPERFYIEANRGQGNGDAVASVFRKHYFDFLRKTRFAWCWFQSSRESSAMWKIYGNQGVAVKTTVGMLSMALEKSGRDFSFGGITYVDYQNGPSVEFNPEHSSDYRLLLRPFFLKRREYESEREVRFVTTARAEGERGGILLRDVKAQDWISAVRLWPGLSTAEENALQNAVKQFFPNLDCQKSGLFSGANKQPDLIEMMLADLGITEGSKWADQGDGIPNELKQL